MPGHFLGLIKSFATNLDPVDPKFASLKRFEVIMRIINVGQNLGNM